jgi:hypothetical protein
MFAVMDTLPQYITPDRDVKELTRRGQISWQALKRDEQAEHWLTIGRAIDGYRHQLFRALKINQPRGHQYKVMMGRFLKDNEWDKIDDGARSNLQRCVENWPAIEQWRRSLPLAFLLKYNHPTVVWQRFLESPQGQPYRHPRKERKQDGAAGQTKPNPKPATSTISYETVKADLNSKTISLEKTTEPDPLLVVLRHSLAAGHIDDPREALAALEQTHPDFSGTIKTENNPPDAEPVWDADKLIQTDPEKASSLVTDLWQKLDTDEKRRRLQFAMINCATTSFRALSMVRPAPIRAMPNGWPISMVLCGRSMVSRSMWRSRMMRLSMPIP